MIESADRVRDKRNPNLISFRKIRTVLSIFFQKKWLETIIGKIYTERRRWMGNIISNTPYDDVYRTMLVEDDELVLPLLNEVFGEHYSGSE